MQKITPFLWFNNNAEEAVNLYTSIFKDSKIISKSPGPDGSVMSMTFQLFGQQFYALNGGPMFSFTEAISLFVSCETQAEIDEYWEKLTANGGQESRCGWLKDKFGLSWQIIPKQLGQMLSDKDPQKAMRAGRAMMGMQKLDMAALTKAYEG